MNIVILTENDTVFLFPMWKKFVEQKKSSDSISAMVTVPSTLGSLRGCEIYWYYISHFGLKTFCKLVWYSCLKQCKNFLSSENGARTFRELARESNATFYSLESPHTQAMIDLLNAHRADVVVSTCGFIIKKNVLSIPKFSFINKHSAYLPHYKGLLPVFWTLKEKKRKVGVSYHLMSPKIDEGKILFQKEYDEHFESVVVAYERIYGDMSTDLWSVLATLERNESKKEENPDFGSYYSLPSKQDVKAFIQNGNKFI